MSQQGGLNNKVAWASRSTQTKMGTRKKHRGKVNVAQCNSNHINH